MDKSEAHVEVEISFLPTEEGGRPGPWRAGYRPQFYYDGANWDAIYQFDNDGPMWPGETVEAVVSFLSPDAHRGRLYPGKEFECREGARVIARGRVTKLLGPFRAEG